MTRNSDRESVLLAALFPLGPLYLFVTTLPVTFIAGFVDSESLFSFILMFCLPAVTILLMLILVKIILRKKPDHLPKLIASFPILGTFITSATFSLVLLLLNNRGNIVASLSGLAEVVQYSLYVAFLQLDLIFYVFPSPNLFRSSFGQEWLLAMASLLVTTVVGFGIVYLCKRLGVLQNPNTEHGATDHT